MRKACGTDGKVHLKTILATGELPTLRHVYQASLVAMMAGSDFIKTSTGKEPVNATIPVGIVMCRAIREYFDRTGKSNSVEFQRSETVGGDCSYQPNLNALRFQSWI